MKKKSYYIDGEIKKNNIVVISKKKNRSSGQGENVKILKKKGKYLYVKSLDLDDKFWIQIKK